MNMHKKIVVSVLLLLSLFASRSAFAGWCVVQNPEWFETYSWSLEPAISVRDEDPIGTVLATITAHPEAQWGGFVTASGNILADCFIGWYVDGATAGGGVWNTNVAGVGLRVYYGGAPVNSSGTTQLSFFGQRDFIRRPMTLELVKTGNVSSISTLNTVDYYYNCAGCFQAPGYDGGGPADKNGLLLRLRPIQIQPAFTAPTCSLSVSNATFDMGALQTTDFNRGAGATYDWVNNQYLRTSTDCNASTVSMTFTGAADAVQNRAFRNNGTAAGVALELWRGGSSDQVVPNSATPIHFPAGPNQDLSFAARYIQTAASVGAGTVTATVTATVNYE
jgi:type 1 fimbria pilin